MQPPPEFPKLEDSPPRRRWQFSLAWLFWLMTMVAAIAVTVRLAFDHPWIGLVLGAYALLIGSLLVWYVYVEFIYGAERRRIRKYRHNLIQWANSRREANRREEVSDGD